MTIRSISAYLFSFRGRICRRWWWLGQIALFLPSLWVINVVQTEANDALLKIALACAIPLAWIDLAVSAKRYHDLNHSGWRQLLSLIPLIGSIWVSIELGFFYGTRVPNRYGHQNVCGAESMCSREEHDN